MDAWNPGGEEQFSFTARTTETRDQLGYDPDQNKWSLWLLFWPTE